MDKALIGVAMAALAASAQGEIVGFDKDPPGALPAGWTAGVTGKGVHWLGPNSSPMAVAETPLRLARPVAAFVLPAAGGNV